MDTHGLGLRSYSRGGRRRKTVLDVDLNVPPPIENHEQVGAPAIPVAQDGESYQTTIPVGQGGQGGRQAIPSAQGGSVPPATINVEELDDDVVISSPRAFAEAKNNSRRSHARTLVVDVESEVHFSMPGPNLRNKRRRIPANQPVINCDLYVNLEGSSSSMRGSSENVAQPPPPPPPPKEPTFSCPVCMGPLVEEVTTKCGHIFCRACIKASIAAQAKCPTCRRKVNQKDIIRVYLPTTN